MQAQFFEGELGGESYRCAAYSAPCLARSHPIAETGHPVRAVNPADADTAEQGSLRNVVNDETVSSIRLPILLAATDKFEAIRRTVIGPTPNHPLADLGHGLPRRTGEINDVFWPKTPDANGVVIYHGTELNHKFQYLSMIGLRNNFTLFVIPQAIKVDVRHAGPPDKAGAPKQGCAQIHTVTPNLTFARGFATESFGGAGAIRCNSSLRDWGVSPSKGISDFACYVPEFGQEYFYYETDIHSNCTIGHGFGWARDRLRQCQQATAGQRHQRDSRRSRSAGSALHQQVTGIDIFSGTSRGCRLHAGQGYCPALFIMKIKSCLSIAASILLVGCNSKSGSTGTATNTTSSGSSPLNAPADYVGALGKAKQTAIKTADTASLDQAIQLFSGEHGRYPKDLNELVEQKLINRIPDAPQGMKIVYDATTGKVSVEKQ
jgi:hypothetical protein